MRLETGGTSDVERDLTQRVVVGGKEAIPSPISRVYLAAGFWNQPTSTVAKAGGSVHRSERGNVGRPG